VQISYGAIIARNYESRVKVVNKSNIQFKSPIENHTPRDDNTEPSVKMTGKKENILPWPN
jgi:hypothetical protein